MTGAMTVIQPTFGAIRPTAKLDTATSEALAAYADARWPVHTRKAVERAWDLTPDEAKALVEGRASKAVWDRILKHKRGGWSVALPVLATVIGQGLDAFVSSERERLADEQRQIEARDRALASMASDLGLALGLGAAGADRSARARRRQTSGLRR